MSNVLSLFKNISTFILDVDGVLTDGTILLMENGLQARKMNIRDGFAIQLAVKKKYRVIIISGGNSPEVTLRLNKLGVMDVHMAVSDKRKVLAEIISASQLKREEILFMGDDLPDLPAMSISGLPCCPADAAPEIKAISRYISSRTGGDGCVRDVIEKVLKLNDDWEFTAGIASN